MGRPRLKKEEKKIKKSIFIYPKTYKVLEEKATVYKDGNIGKYLTKLVDDAILDKKTTIATSSKKTKVDLYSTLRELNKVGSNINQLTKLAHEGKIYETELTNKLQELKKEIGDVNLKISELLSK